jgi:putative PIN family toxin of toxin-antitoxin system
MYRVVLDTSVIVAALRSSRGASHALLRLVAEAKLIPLATSALFLEYEDVLKRPEQRMEHNLTIAQIDGFLSSFASACQPVDVHFRWRPMLNDAADEMVLEAAYNGRADALVTHNVRDFLKAADFFALRVLRPGEFLKEIK